MGIRFVNWEPLDVMELWTLSSAKYDIPFEEHYRLLVDWMGRKNYKNDILQNVIFSKYGFQIQPGRRV